MRRRIPRIPTESERIDDLRQEVINLCAADIRYGPCQTRRLMILDLTLIIDQFDAVREFESIISGPMRRSTWPDPRG